MVPLSRPHAIVFDMDGVLIDSERAWELSENHYLARIAPKYTAEHHHLVIGIRLRDLHQLMVKEFAASVSWGEFEQHYQRAGKDIYENRCALTPGAPRTLAALKQRGIVLALASSSPHNWIETALRRFRLSAYFDHVVSGDDVPHGKPAPHIYTAAVDALGQSPERCWAVEDTDVGLQSAKSAGLCAIGYHNGNNQHQSFQLADQELTRLDALPALLSQCG